MKYSYEEFNDLFFKYKANQNDQFLLRELIQRLKPLISSMIRIIKNSYSKIPLESNDLENLSIFSIYKSVKKFDLKKSNNKTPLSFLKQHLEWDLRNELKKYVNNKHKILNFYTEISVENITDKVFDDSEEIMNEFKNNFFKFKLSKIEIEVLELLLEGKSINEVSKKMNILLKTAYSIRTRIRNKIEN